MSAEAKSGEFLDWGDPVNLSVFCRRQDYDLTLGNQALRVAGIDSDVSIPLKEEERIFTRHLMLNPDRGYLQGEIKKNTSISDNARIEKVYTATIKALSAHMIRDNFINFDRGRSKKYALLQNSKNPDVLMSRETDIINGSLVSDRRKEKRLRELKHIDEFYYGSDKHEFSKKKIAGMIATGSVLVIGGVVYKVHRNVGS